MNTDSRRNSADSAADAVSAAAPAPPALSTDPRQVLGKPDGGWRARLYAVIFESDTPTGRAFDLVLIGAILLSVLVVVLATVKPIADAYGPWLVTAEWCFTVLFTVEYVARCLCVRRPLVYARGFFGVIDLMSILPNYVALVFPGAHVVLGLRILRLLRIFRILKLTLYIQEYSLLSDALLASRRKIFVFLSVVFLIVFLLGSVMYVVEGPANGYTSIPTAVYWAISTMTTVGFGDLVPKTDIGRTIASFMMLLGWGILAVPTGIISSEFTHRRGLQALGMPDAGLSPQAPAPAPSGASAPVTPPAWSPAPAPSRTCARCHTPGHEPAARFCKDCGAALPA